MKQAVWFIALASLAFTPPASNANAQHVDDSLAEPARRFEATMIAADTPDARRSMTRDFLRLLMFGGMIGPGSDGSEAIYIFTRSSYAYETMGASARIRLPFVWSVAAAAARQQLGILVNPGQPSEFYMSPAEVVEALEANPDLVIPPPPPVIFR